MENLFWKFFLPNWSWARQPLSSARSTLLYPFQMLSAKQGSSNSHLLTSFGMTRPGIEPTTSRLWGGRSTDWANTHRCNGSPTTHITLNITTLSRYCLVDYILYHPAPSPTQYLHCRLRPSLFLRPHSWDASGSPPQSLSRVWGWTGSAPVERGGVRGGWGGHSGSHTLHHLSGIGGGGGWRSGEKIH